MRRGRTRTWLVAARAGSENGAVRWGERLLQTTGLAWAKMKYGQGAEKQDGVK